MTMLQHDSISSGRYHKKINYLKIKKENKQITYYNIINVDVTLTATMEGWETEEKFVVCLYRYQQLLIES